MRQWLLYYERRYGELSYGQRRLVKQVSAATLDRLLASARAQHSGRGRGGTKPGSLLRSEIPIRTGTWDLSQPGYLEADSVAHCGGSLAGSFIWSLTYTDILSGWTEGGAVWNKGATGVLAATREVEERLPFELLGFDSDNGGEFLNHHLWTYMRERKAAVEFTRSRPYHSDDNAHVEQKNWTHIRQCFGYERHDNPEVVEPINVLVKGAYGQLLNYFHASLKLERKERTESRLKRIYGAAQTPLARVLASAEVTRETKLRLQQEKARLNPFALKREVDRSLKAIAAQRHARL